MHIGVQSFDKASWLPCCAVVLVWIEGEGRTVEG